MNRPSVDGKPIDTPSASDYIEEARTFFRDEPGDRILELIQGLADSTGRTGTDVKRDIEKLSRALKKRPKLVRNLNAVLPRGFAVQCPVVDVAVLEFFVLLSSDGGQILSTSDDLEVPSPSSTQELRVILPLKDNWESIQAMCLVNVQWGCCLSQLLQREFEDSRIDEDYKRVVSRRQVHLAKLTRSLPPSLFLHNIMGSTAVPVEWGGFADIDKATINGTSVCLKILRVYLTQDDNVKKSKAFFREVLLWSRLSHPNILPFLGAKTTGFRFALISPWMKNGNLRTFLKVNPDHDRLSACFQISCGLQYLHGLLPPIHHRDVKAVNVLVKDDLQCCLADFGLSSIDGSQDLWQSKSHGGGGTMHWQPPEVVLSPSSEIFDKKLDSAPADVYAYGCTFFEVYTGNHPFHDLQQGPLVLAHLEKRKPELPEANKLKISEKLRAFMALCWNSAPERPTMSDVKSNLEDELALREASGPLSSYRHCLGDKVPPALAGSLGKPETRLDEPEELVAENLVTAVSDYYRSHYQQMITTEVPRSVLEISVPAEIAPNGLVTPPTNDHISVFPVSLLTEPRLTEEPEAMEHVKDLTSRLGINTDDLLTPPETPTLSPVPAQLNLRMGGKAIQTHALSIDATEFRPSSKSLCTSTVQKSTIPTSSTVAMPVTPTSPLARHSSLNASAVEFSPIFRPSTLQNSTITTSSTVAMPVTPTSPLARHNTLNASAVEFSPILRPSTLQNPTIATSSTGTPTSPLVRHGMLSRSLLNPSAAEFSPLSRSLSLPQNGTPVTSSSPLVRRSSLSPTAVEFTPIRRNRSLVSERLSPLSDALDEMQVDTVLGG